MKRFFIAAGGAAVLVLGALGVSYAQAAPTTPTPNVAQTQSAAHPLAKMRRESLQVAASTIGLADVKALRTELAGSTLTDVAQRHGVQPSAVASAITADLDAKIQSLASAGTIKSKRVTALDQKVTTRVAALMTHQFAPAKSNH